MEGGTAGVSERLCEGAHRRRNDNREDDITVITAILKNPFENILKFFPLCVILPLV
ncbi:MAG: hypothetical protein ACLR56_08900 [Oscillospiraceae bacterium]